MSDCKSVILALEDYDCRKKHFPASEVIVKITKSKVVNQVEKVVEDDYQN